MAVQIHNTLFEHRKTEQGASVCLRSPTAMDKASHFLWNEQQLVQINCQGYVNAQFMQPEPSKYSRGPSIEATTFMQPEMPFYAEHPGRFVFIKDEETGEVFSIPYAPMKKTAESFEFHCHSHKVEWQIEQSGLLIQWQLTLPPGDTLEVWQLVVKNLTSEQRILSVYPCFSIGFMSWMNQSANFNQDYNSIIARSVTPYQKVENYFTNQYFKDLTFFHSNKKPDSWCANWQSFIGERGIHAPESLNLPLLPQLESCYEMPVAVMQFNTQLAASEADSFEFLFGPAHSEKEIEQLIERHSAKFENTLTSYQQQQAMGKDVFYFATSDSNFDDFVNGWLPRQAVYHGELNRLTTDPQTRNFLQDTMALMYFSPEKARDRILLAVAQQEASGQMPDGILLDEKATLKYINQIPHTDHCVWLVLCLKSYLDETADHSILNEVVGFACSDKTATVASHVELAVEWLLSATNEHGLSYIDQGDWCDPMNMVGYKGKGVSSWLTIATCYALKVWVEVCKQYISQTNPNQIEEYKASLSLLKQTIRRHFKVGEYFARGITDDGRTFGTLADKEGKIFLNPQSWALLAQVLEDEEIEPLVRQVMQQLATEHGVAMLAPAYTHMHEDIGRVTQKYPGSAENGSVYNHAAAFWAFAMFEQNMPEQGFDVLHRMVTNEQNAEVTGQLPCYIPNYYRGSRAHSIEHLGRSSHLFNTGTLAWYLKALFEGLAGFKPDATGVVIRPQVPAKLKTLSYRRQFRGAEFNVTVTQTNMIGEQQTKVNGELCEGNRITQVSKGMVYQVDILIPWQQPSRKKLIVITGVSGSGKSTVAKDVANQLGYVFMDADEFHSRKARAKMANGVALTDEDRVPWLARMHEHLKMLHVNQQNVVLAYSGLKQAHRSEFNNLPFDLQFHHLDLSFATLKQRLSARKEHFFAPELLASQIDSFEPYHGSEGIVHQGEAPVSELSKNIISRHYDDV